MPKETWTLWCRRDTEARMTRLTSSVWLSIWRSFWSVDYNQMSYIILDIVYCKIVFKIRNKRRKIARPQKIKFKKNTHLPQKKKKKLKFIFFQLECCGIESGSEFNSTVTNWNTTYVYQSGGSYTVATATIPLTCCEFSNKDAFPTDVTTFYNSMTNNQCPINQANSYYNQVKLHTLISFQLSSSVFTTKLQSKLFFRKKKTITP